MDTINIGTFGFLEAIAGLTIEVKNISVKIAVMFAVLTAIYGVVKFFLGFEDGQKINFNKYVWAPLITIFLLSNYSYIIDVTDSVGSIIINNMPSAGDKSVFTELLNSAEKRRAIEMTAVWSANREVLNDEERNFFQKVGGSIINSINEDISRAFTPFRMLGKLFQASWISFCRIIVENVRGVILAFLVIVGPLAMLFSIIPLFREMFQKWYKMYVSVMMWAVTLNILDALVISFANTSVAVDLQAVYIENHLTNEEALAAVESANHIMGDFGTQAGYLNFVLGMMYLCVPLLTAFFIGDKMAGGMLSFVMMKTVDFTMKAASAIVTKGASFKGTSVGGGGSTSGTT